MALSRRDLIRNSALGAGVLATGNISALIGSGTAAGAAPALDLIPDPAGLLDLPPGFAYSVISREGDQLSTGAAVPGRFDGMGAFAGSQKSVALVRNHEQSTSGSSSTVDGVHSDFVYDPLVWGGTSTVVLDKHGTRTDEYVSLAGTRTNCAGGTTPWGTWLTCEETDAVTANASHGWVFEVDPWNQDNNRNPTPLTSLGRAPHEAAVVDPATLDIYLTEDASNPLGLVTRCQLDDPRPEYGGLRGDGHLTAMVCTDGGSHVPNLHPYSEIGTELAVSWIDVPDPAAATTAMRRQFTDDQVTRSRKFEGMWWDSGKAYIVCSFAEGFHDGQVWSLDPAAGTLTLEVRFQIDPVNHTNGDTGPDQPDNITISPWGGMVLCEDSAGGQHVLTVDGDGNTSLFARNRINNSEFAGACFSPDRHTLYVNVQSPGHTFAITGPFARLAR